MGSLKDHLLASLRQLVLDHLPYDRNDAEVVSQLSSEGPGTLLRRWINWRTRLLLPEPRQIFPSREFLANPILHRRSLDIQALLDDIRTGEDLTKYLSRRVVHGYVSPNGKKRHRREDLDLMLNAWGIHHLHFSRKVEADGFVERDNPIIFAIFRKGRVYLIDILFHGDWAREHVVQVIVNNWPDAGLVHEMKGVDLVRPVTDQERLELQNVQINTVLKIDGKVYWPGGGMTAAGFGVNASRAADYVVLELEAFASMFEQDPQSIASRAEGGKKGWPDEPEFAVEFRPDAFGVVELKSGIFFPLGAARWA